jgi:hypothetical protein
MELEYFEIEIFIILECYQLFKIKNQLYEKTCKFTSQVFLSGSPHRKPFVISNF